MSDRNELSFSRRDFLFGSVSLATFGSATMAGRTLFANGAAENPTDLAAASLPADPALGFSGVWAFDLPKRGIILVADSQLEELTDPDKEVNLSLSAEPNFTTLRKICEEAKAAGVRTLILAFDEFWKQYRTDITEPRALFPDSDRYIELVSKISRFASEYGLGLELSLLSPLEIGKRFAEQTGEYGRWVQFREGYRDPITGRFDVSLWEHKTWGNNKGTTRPERDNVRVFAFCEREKFGDEPYSAVIEEEIIELSGPFDIVDDPSEGRALVRMTVSGTGSANSEEKSLDEFDRVMVVVSYRTPEMDYFSPKALPFLEELIGKYHDASIDLNALYSDEIHIQQDWNYFNHHDAGQFTLRYLSDDLCRVFAERYGEKYRDFEKYLVYFCVGQHDFLPSVESRFYAQHAPTADHDGVRATWLLRRRYYDLLHETVVNLFAGVKKFAQEKYGKMLEARAHATWAQSPTIDRWRTSGYSNHYEYTSDFVWSNTVHQASAACDDYFRWNDFLTGGGNDHAEGGWSDRNYYGQAIACSTGSLNDTPNAYAACWGMPDAVAHRHHLIEAAYGNATFSEMKALEFGAHRSIEVLMLYPISLVACQERFGSWITQYGYANYVTAEKLLQYGKITDDGAVDLRGRKYTTLCALYEPIPPAGLMEFIEKFIAAGGRVIWSGPPATVDLTGAPIFDRWRRCFGIGEMRFSVLSRTFPGRRVEFEGTFAGMEPMTILTDFAIDGVYPHEPLDGNEVLGQCDFGVVASRRGNAVYLGYRPRDDQSASLGYETRGWFDALYRLGAYRSDDDPTVVSRNSEYLATVFPNGAVAIVKHYRRHRESWGGGFRRDEAADAEALKNNPLDSDAIALESFAVAGHTVDYSGTGIVGFRVGQSGGLVAFYGTGANRIGLDGREYVLSESPFERIAFSPVAPERRVAGGAVLEIWTTGTGTLRLPLEESLDGARLYRRRGMASCGEEVPSKIADGVLEFDTQGAAAFLLVKSI